MRLSLAKPIVDDVECDVSFGEIMFTTRTKHAGIEAFFSIYEDHFLKMVAAYNAMKTEEASRNGKSSRNAGDSEEVSTAKSGTETLVNTITATGVDIDKFIAGRDLDKRISVY